MKSVLERRRRLVTIVPLVVVVMLLAGAVGSGFAATSAKSPTGKSRAVKKKRLPVKKIGLLQINAAPTAVAIRDALTQATKITGWNLDICEGAGDAVKISACMSSLVVGRPDAIITIGTSPASVRRGIDEAKSKGIPVIVVGGRVNPDPAVTAQFVPSEFQLSAAITKFVATKFGSSAVNAGMFTLNPLPSLALRRVGLERGLFNDAKGVKIVESHDTLLSNPFADTIAATQAMMRSNPSIKLIFALPGFDLPPVASVLKDLGRDDVTLVGYYAEPATIPLIKSGAVHAVSSVDPRYFLWVAMDQLVRHFGLGAKIVPGAKGPIPPVYSTITAANVDQAARELVSNPPVQRRIVQQWTKLFTNVPAR
jgi:ABC-type sugar transport system substrate-binding protein